MLTTIPASATRPFAWRTAVWLARLRRLVNRFLAAVIARHERHAMREALRKLDDRHLEDIGMYRTQIDSSLEELAQTRARMQQPGWH
ncbi:hypothetical protein LMTR3_34895 [Bradyrhizobium sp. LMTR 3]|nr:hypothetical protein LMTR3_34895 [Bradyrhizobium sp. LMTR 3]